MMPPISGMQAIAAATFDGNPVDVDVALDLDPEAGCDGLLGLVSSGTLYIHELEKALSSNLAPAGAVVFSDRPAESFCLFWINEISQFRFDSILNQDFQFRHTLHVLGGNFFSASLFSFVLHGFVRVNNCNTVTIGGYAAEDCLFRVAGVGKIPSRGKAAAIVVSGVAILLH